MVETRGLGGVANVKECGGVEGDEREIVREIARGMHFGKIHY